MYQYPSSPRKPEGLHICICKDVRMLKKRTPAKKSGPGTVFLLQSRIPLKRSSLYHLVYPIFTLYFPLNLHSIILVSCGPNLNCSIRRTIMCFIRRWYMVDYMALRKAS